MLKLSHFLICYLIFLLFGALIFYESNVVEEKKRHIYVNNQIKQFINRNNKCLKEHDLYFYVDYFLDKSHTGLWYSSSSKANITKWTFGQGLFFITSLITTVGYGAPNLITSYGKILCIIYTGIGLILASLFQQILHHQLIPIFYRIIFQLAMNRYIIYYFTRYRSFFVSFLLVTFLITLLFIIIPTLFIHNMYVPKWSLIELTYFAVTTNYLIGFGDLMPCSDLYGQSRSTCAIILTIYVIIQVLAASILSHMWFILPRKSHQFLRQQRHHSDPNINMIDNKKFSIDINDKLLENVFT
ncbi:unnamed protein product [Rotaria sordida]|uniref:Potassium channel domain-containing protein n=1 Tax=Rotaria sordida TaxID=392033 RepID=A0A814ARZ6_9BILA|nr:unnamed protein product [Rotaria sordida]CAF0918850.1 unnamed protein product [Rotaria sordida]